jgi:hypothetical protein
MKLSGMSPNTCQVSLRSIHPAGEKRERPADTRSIAELSYAIALVIYAAPLEIVPLAFLDNAINVGRIRCYRVFPGA